MTRPNLVNPHWTPFKNMPIPPIAPSPPSPPIVSTPPRYMTKEEIIKKNSLSLNVFGILVLIGLSYFLYSIYLERKVLSDYLEQLDTHNIYSPIIPSPMIS